MATLRQIQRRIKSIQSTAKTTRAMSLVAGSKMRRAQLMATSHRPYAEQLNQLLVDVIGSLPAAEEGLEAATPLLARREIKSHGLILVTPDRGLCGGLNTSLIRQAGLFIQSHPNTKLITVGRKGYDFYRRTGTEVIAHFANLGDYPFFDDVRPISRLAQEAYISGEVDSVSLIFSRFVNTVVQRPEQLDLLPVTPPEGNVRPVEYIYEPDPREVLASLLPRYVDVQVYRAVLENAASYQSAQMVAMRNATDAAQDMILQLTLVRNKVRQEQITKELLDITGGVEALSN